MSKQRKKHSVLVAQRKKDNVFVRNLERCGGKPKMPARCRRWIRLLIAENRSKWEKDLAIYKLIH